ncbi:ribose-phosphate diphosphokinase [Deferribacter abyssi]|uniref:ribose-phosphate diphosphokinase n=1 Tax=Deferribacter abyssi TaxID=213806 RepID=UPI003C264143
MGKDMDFLVFSGNSNKSLAVEIVQKLGMRLSDATVTQFSDGEIFVRINESVRGRDVFVIQSSNYPADRHLMELMIMVDALRRASANSVTAVMPYFGYARQDRTVEPRVPITAKLVANILTTSGIDRMVTMDLHAGQIQGFFDIPVDNLYASPIITKYFIENKMMGDDYVVVSPDAGGVPRARAYAKVLQTSLAIIDKRRIAPNEAKAMYVVGNVKDKHVIIIDDMIDTAGTLTEAANAVLEMGALSVRAAATHAVLSGPAIERIVNSCLEEIIVTNTIELSKEKTTISKIKVLSVAEIFAEAIKRIHKKESISSLFVN